jgi:hypothetical protein
LKARVVKGDRLGAAIPQPERRSHENDGGARFFGFQGR